jgi:3-carboxy-cis,cis-muconate cycloisomerase
LSADLWAPLFGDEEILAATSGRAWIRAMLDAEAALAVASARFGLLPAEAAEAIESACATLEVDPAELAVRARPGGNPVIPLVAELRSRVPHGYDQWVHRGATSQDIVDTAAILVTSRAGRVIDLRLGCLEDGCAALADAHRDTLMLARTLLQPALPTTFGAKAAGWLGGVLDARRLLSVALDELTASLAGAAGTLAVFGDQGPQVGAAFAAHLGLPEPLLPWHTARQRVAALGAALAIATATAAKVTGDVALLMQAEVGEAAEPAPGGSSTLPHKRNPVAATLVSAAARQAAALAGVLLGSVVAEHERPVGAWHAEWSPLTDLLTLTGAAIGRAADTVAGLDLDPAAMRANLDAVPSLLAERVTLALAPCVGWAGAAGAVERALASGDFAGTLRTDPEVVAVLDPVSIAALLDPAGYTGSAGVWVDRALAAHRRQRDRP